MPQSPPAANKPVARVLPLLGIAHLDRTFDYLVTDAQDAEAQPGVRVRIRFNGKLVDGLLLERCPDSDFDKELRFIDRVVSSFVVYPRQLAELVESLAQRYGGVRSDIIRSAIPPRHVRAEDSDFTTSWEDLGAVEEPDLSAWSSYLFGESFVDSVIAGTPARAAWQIAPGENWADCLAALGAKIALQGRGILIIVPDARNCDVVEQAFRKYVSAKQIVVLGNSPGPQARYRRYLSAVEGQARIVIGTRSAAFTPLLKLGLAVIVDDGNDNLVERLAPYIHAREVLTTRSALESCSLIIAGHARTAETQLLVNSGWMHDLVAPPAVLEKRAPSLQAVGPFGVNLSRAIAHIEKTPGTTSLDTRVYQTLKGALGAGKPVLVQAPRKGQAPVLACGKCRTRARCRQCNGPLHLSARPDNAETGSYPTCGWCGRIETKFTCNVCGSTSLRAQVMGQEHTAEELGRVFPNTRIIVSGGNRVVEEVPDSPAIVVATPGAEPRVSGEKKSTPGKYGAALLLEPNLLLNRQDLRAGEEALAKWCTAATLVAPAHQGGVVIITGDQAVTYISFFLRWDVVGAARHELAARKEVGFPPAVHMVALDGAAAAMEDFMNLVELPVDSEVLGPVPLPAGEKLPGDYDANRFGPPQRLLIRSPLGPRGQLGKALKTANAQRSARKETLPLRIQVDPVNIG